jgi:hypothetical protein
MRISQSYAYLFSIIRIMRMQTQAVHSAIAVRSPRDLDARL